MGSNWESNQKFLLFLKPKDFIVRCYSTDKFMQRYAFAYNFLAVFAKGLKKVY
jgi:hypothetical protein